MQVAIGRSSNHNVIFLRGYQEDKLVATTSLTRKGNERMTWQTPDGFLNLFNIMIYLILLHPKVIHWLCNG
jgi:hypothetical protein